LEAFLVEEVDGEVIAACVSSEKLRMWAEAFRKKWVLTKRFVKLNILIYGMSCLTDASHRTVESRTKHHNLFYGGGDISHQAFIAKITFQKTRLEDMLLAIDDRAYSVRGDEFFNAALLIVHFQLLLTAEKAEWLQAPAAPAPTCDEDFAFVPAIPSPPLTTTSTSNSTEDSGSESDASISSDTAASETASSVSCASSCCQPASPPKPPSARDRLLAYQQYSSHFVGDPHMATLAQATIDNIFRYVISRTPRLLVRARRSQLNTVTSFLTGDELQEVDFDRLWRALKYSNIHQVGKITVDVLRNAICNAEDEQPESEGAFIEILGGKVWETANAADLSEDGWDLFYRLVGTETSIHATP